MQAALFHLRKAALGGVPHALVILAKVHCGLEPELAPFAALAREGRKTGATLIDIPVATRLLELAAERGVVNAAKALVQLAQLGPVVLGAAGDAPGVGVTDGNNGSSSGGAGAQAARWFDCALRINNGHAEDSVRASVCCGRVRGVR